MDKDTLRNIVLNVLQKHTKEPQIISTHTSIKKSIPKLVNGMNLEDAGFKYFICDTCGFDILEDTVTQTVYCKEGPCEDQLMSKVLKKD